MRTHLREPDTLVISVIRGAQRGETALIILHEENGFKVTIWDDWAPVPDRAIPALLERCVSLWTSHGPLAPMGYLRAVGRPGAR